MEERVLAGKECSSLVEEREGGGGWIEVDSWHISNDWELK